MTPIFAGDRQVTHLDLHGSLGCPGLQVSGLGERREGVAVGSEEGEDHFEHEVSRPGLRCRRLNVRTVLALMLSPALGGGLCTPWVCFEHSCVFSVGVSRRTREPLALAALGGGLLGSVAGPAGLGSRTPVRALALRRTPECADGPAAPAPAPAPAASLRRPLLAALCSWRGEHGRRLQNRGSVWPIVAFLSCAPRVGGGCSPSAWGRPSCLRTLSCVPDPQEAPSVRRALSGLAAACQQQGQ